MPVAGSTSLDPLLQRAYITAHSHLPFARLAVREAAVPRQFVGVAHDILPQGLEAVQRMLEDVLGDGFVAGPGPEVLAEVLLVGVSKGTETHRAHKAI